jgi:hypothetical protein
MKLQTNAICILYNDLIKVKSWNSSQTEVMQPTALKYVFCTNIAIPSGLFQNSKDI